MKAEKLWKLLEHLSLNKFNVNPKITLVSEEKKPECKEKSVKRAVRFKNQKMIISTLLLLFTFSHIKASENVNVDGCTIPVVATSTNVTSPGCASGTITFDPETNEAYTWEIRVLPDLTSIAANSSSTPMYQDSYSLGDFMAASYQINILTESGCTGSAQVTITQPPCPSPVVPTITVTNASVYGANDAAINVSFNTTSTCGVWYYSLTKDGSSILSNYLTDPPIVPGILSYDLLNLEAGNYQLILNPGGNLAYPTACYSSTSFEITQPPCDIAISDVIVNNSVAAGCNSGSITANLLGNTLYGYYVAELYQGLNLVNTFYPTETDGNGMLELSFLSPGEYSIIVSNGATCTQSHTFTITEPGCNLLVSDFVENNPTVSIGNNGSVYFTISGGNCVGYYYYELYQNGAFAVDGYFNSTDNIALAEILNLSEGTYQLNIYGNFLLNCLATKTFSLELEPCNLSINNFETYGISAAGCDNGALNFNVSGTTAYGYYAVELFKDGLTYANYYIYPTGSQTPVWIENLPAGNYTIVISDGAPTPCIVQSNTLIYEPACIMTISNPVVTQIPSNGAFGGINVEIAGYTCTGTYLLKLFKDGAEILAQPINGFTYSNQLLEAGNYSLVVYNSTTNFNCSTSYDFTINPLNNASIGAEVLLGNPQDYCNAKQIKVNIAGLTQGIIYGLAVKKLNDPLWPDYVLMGTLMADPGVQYASHYGYPGQYNFILYSVLAPAVILGSTTATIPDPVCNTAIQNLVVSGAVTNGCSNGSVAFEIYDEIDCPNSFNYVLNKNGILYEQGMIGKSGNTTPFSFSNLTSGTYTLNLTQPINNINYSSCTAQTSFTINETPCNIAISNLTTSPGCYADTLSFTLSGETCNGVYKVYLANNTTNTVQLNYYSLPKTGVFTNFKFGELLEGNYTLRVFSETGATCYAEQNFNVGQFNCNLGFENLVVTNVSADYSLLGSINYNIVFNSACNNNYQIDYYRNGTYFYGFNIPKTGTITPTSASSMPEGNWYVTISNGNCSIAFSFVIGVGNTCAINTTNLITTQPSTSTSNDGSIAVTAAGNSCSGSMYIEVFKNGTLFQTQNIPATASNTSINIPNLSEGNYTLNIFNGCSDGINPCFTTQNVSLISTELCNVVINDVTSTNVTSNGANDGTITFNITGNQCGGNNYEVEVYLNAVLYSSANYPATGALTNLTLTNIPAGAIQVIVKNGCTVSGTICAAVTSVNITEPAACNLQLSVSNEIYASTPGCNDGLIDILMQGNAIGNNYQLNVSKDGVSVLSSSYPSTNPVTQTLNHLLPGVYDINLSYTGSGSCAANLSYELLSNPCNLLISNVQIDTAQAFNFCVEGSVEFDLSGTLCGPSEVKLKRNSDGLTYHSSMVSGSIHLMYNEIPPGDYTLFFTTASCTTNYAVHIPDRNCYLSFVNPTLNIEGSGTCTNAYFTSQFGGARCKQTEITITNTSTGLVQQTASLYPDPVQVYNFDNIPAGNYNVSAIAENGCTANYNLNIASQPCDNIQFSNVTLGQSTNACTWDFGYDLNLGNCPGSVLTLSKNGNLLNTYNLVSTVSTEINNLTAGNYNLHLTTPSGCNIDYPFEVNPSCNLAIADITTTTTCDDWANGSVEFNVNGDFCGIATLQMLDIANNVISTQFISNTGSFNYQNLDVNGYGILVTSANGCTATAPFDIEPLCDLNLFNETLTLEGTGSCTTGNITYQVLGNACSANIVRLVSASDLTVLYQSNIPDVDGIDVYEINDIPLGIYTLQITNNAGTCVDNYIFNVTPAPCSALEFSNVTINPSNTDGCYYAFGYDLNLGNCPGSVLTLNQNGTVLETYNLVSDVSTEINTLTPGNYILHLNTASGCVLDYPFEITPAACNIVISDDIITTTGVADCTEGTITFNVNGTTCGTGAVALVQNGSIVSLQNWTTNNGNGLSFTNINPGNYSLVAINNLLNATCGDTLNFAITENPCNLSIANITTSTTGVSNCTLGNISFEASGTICGLGGVIISDISTGAVASQAYNNSGSQTFTFGNLPPGNYEVLFGNLSCNITQAFTITDGPCDLSIENNITSTYGVLNCTFSNISVEVSGTTCGASFVNISDSNNDIIASQLYDNSGNQTLSFINIPAGNYEIFFGNALCNTTQAFTIAQNPCYLAIANLTSTPSSGSNGTINVTGSGNYCNGVSLMLEAEISIGNWAVLTTVFNVMSTQFTGLAPGNYRVTISGDGNTCNDVEYITVTGAICNTNPNISANSTTVCPGLPVILNSNYLTGNVWSNGGNSFNTQVTTAGTYTLTVTEPNGCTGSTSIIITNATTCVPATQMSNNVCGTLNYVRTSSVTCLPVSGATQYEWQFSNSSGVFATKITSTNYVLLHSVTPALNWGTNWNIKVRAKIGANVGPYSPDCNIGIMPDPSINGVPQTQLRTQDCNKQNYRMNADNRIIANPISGAIQYEFEFSSASTGNVVAIRLQANNVLFLNTVTPALTFPAQYNVRVRARIGSTWGVFGTPCLIGIIGLNREEANTSEEAEIISDELSVEVYFDMVVMPNPFNEQAFINIHSSNDEQVNVEVFDMVGNIVWTQLIPTNTNINFGIELAQGTYMAKAISKDGKQTMFRFIKTK